MSIESPSGKNSDLIEGDEISAALEPLSPTTEVSRVASSANPIDANGTSEATQPMGLDDAAAAATTSEPTELAQGQSSKSVDQNQPDLAGSGEFDRQSDNSIDLDSSNDQSRDERQHEVESGIPTVDVLGEDASIGGDNVGETNIALDHTMELPLKDDEASIKDEPMTDAEKVSVKHEKDPKAEDGAGLRKTSSDGTQEGSVEPSTEATMQASLSASNSPSAEELANQLDDVDADADDYADIPDGPLIKRQPIKQTHSIVIPSYASWFKMKKIHRIEKESLPEFFNVRHPSKSPKIYISYRNFMINAYRLNPNEYLTLTSCRRNLVGDVGTLMRVHRFLNKWGLINYQVNPSFKPGYAVEKLPNGLTVGLPYTGDFHVQYDTPRGLFPFNTYKPSTDNIDIGKLRSFLQLKHQDSDSNSPSVSTNTKKRQAEHLESGKDKHGRKSDNWTSSETTKLISAVKQHRNDWYKISKSVGSKKPEECILKFLKIPIEDASEDKDASLNSLGILRYALNFPVSSVDNPVLSTLAFMTQLVDSEVARAASLRALQVIGQQSLDKIKELNSQSKASTSAAEDKGRVLNALQDSKNLEEVTKPQAEPTELAEKATLEASAKTEDGADVQMSTNSLKTNTESPSSPPDEGPAAMPKLETLADASATTFGIVGARSHLFANYEEREMNRLAGAIVDQQLSKIDIKLSKVDELEKTLERERQFIAKQQEELFIDRLALTNSTIQITKKLTAAMSLLRDNQQAKPQSKQSQLDHEASKTDAETQDVLMTDDVEVNQAQGDNGQTSTTTGSTNDGEAHEGTLNVNSELSKGEAMQTSQDVNTILQIVQEVEALLYKPLRQALVKTSTTSGAVEADTELADAGAEVHALEEIKPLSIEMPQTFKVWAP